MLAASLAVLRSPSIETFEAHERTSALWAAVYVVLGAIPSALLAMLATVLHRPYLDAEYDPLLADLNRVVPGTAQDSAVERLLVPVDAGSAAATSLASTLLGFVVFVCVVYVLGRVLGGRGAFGELAFDVALFWAPLSVLSSLINLLSIGVLAFVAVPLGLAVGIYQLYLTFLSIRSGMNLSAGRALAVILLPVLALLVLFCVLVGLIVAVDGGS